MKLIELLNEIKTISVKGNPDIEIQDIMYDSRTPKKESLFVCLKGYTLDGHDYVNEVYKMGVRSFVVEKDVALPDDAVTIFVENTRVSLAYLSAAFFGFPSKKLITVALTGTKGKTSASFMIKSILEKSGKKVGVIGTIGIFYGNTHIETDNSTPESYEIHKYFAKMLEIGCDTVVIEATSQGFMMHRTNGIIFDIGIFTNLSRDHIGGNEHPDFEHYVNCKKQLFRQSEFAVFNRDSEYWEIMLEGSNCPYTTFGMSDGADYTGSTPQYITEKNHFFTYFYCKNGLEMHKIEVSIPGQFSVYNALVAIACTRQLNSSYEDIRSGLRTTVVKGRMEILPDTEDFTVIIDYAHNELSMQSLYNTINLYSHNKIYTVFGCGGNRSKLRRFAMGEISGQNSDLSIITSDNPRLESVIDIIEDIIKGIEPTGGEYEIIVDRKSAIFEALEKATKGDIVLIVGKGHQDYEEIQGEKYPFDERLIVAEYFERKSSNKQ
ncbi:MAG: hypothetical protein A2Y17_02695 [Clostridiales bacterium GWF2_38_85]|nr:MAG: hypothetical protein A2Y17_02695 [Clostridiales bacterium GWF2_38_85]